jgi:hypothetical protein
VLGPGSGLPDYMQKGEMRRGPIRERDFCHVLIHRYLLFAPQRRSV